MVDYFYLNKIVRLILFFCLQISTNIVRHLGLALITFRFLSNNKKQFYFSHVSSIECIAMAKRVDFCGYIELSLSKNRRESVIVLIQ